MDAAESIPDAEIDSQDRIPFGGVDADEDDRFRDELKHEDEEDDDPESSFDGMTGFEPFIPDESTLAEENPDRGLEETRFFARHPVTMAMAREASIARERHYDADDLGYDWRQRAVENLDDGYGEGEDSDFVPTGDESDGDEEDIEEEYDTLLEM